MIRSYLLLTIYCLLFFKAEAYGFSLGGGLASVEEGDDRHRPAVVAHLGFTEHIYSHIYYYGRKFGPVTERTVIASANYKVNIFGQFGWTFLKGNLGLCLMNEQTKISFPGDSENSETENAGNFGFVGGLLADIPVAGPMFMNFSWESHMFLAGQAGAFMANGRKQGFSLIAGFDF